MSVQLTSELSKDEQQALRDLVHGVVLTLPDKGYDDARRLFNGAIDRRPAAIVAVSGPADVAATLTFARERGLSVSVRGGGHGVAGHAVGGDVVIDLSALHGVRVDPQAGTAVVGGGSTWGAVDAATQAYGLAVPGGRVTHTGVAGLTLGGGEGWLSPRYGLTSDNLISAEIVTADGRVVVASADREPELFWALRGGGGNFGVVTSFTFRLHPVGPLVLGGLVLYDLRDATAVFGVIADLAAADHDEFAGAAVFMSAPPAPFVPADLVGRPVLAVVPAWLGDPAVGAATLRPLFERVRPLVDASASMPYVALQSMIDESAPAGLRQQWAAAYLPALPDPLVDDLAEAARSFPSPMSHIIVSPLGGAVARTAADATAYPHRDAAWLVHPVAQWGGFSGDPEATAWTRSLGERVRGYGEMGTYLNLEDADDARVRWAFGEQRYRRLQAVKAAWDPDDVFQHCNHIALPAGGER